MSRKQKVFTDDIDVYVRNHYQTIPKKTWKARNFFTTKGPKFYRIKKTLIILGVSFLLALLVGYIRYYFVIIKNLPNIKNLDSVVFSEATVITDRNNEVLYKMYQENREYVTIDQISENMINAIIAVEDKSFRTNPGISFQGITRTIMGQMGLINYDGGGSTITQQLLKNILLDPTDNKYKRKLKERALAGRLNSLIKEDIRKEYQNLTPSQVQKKSKEKILEMYLNYIFLGQNAYGVQAAAKTYFNTDAKTLNPLQAAIIASLPKSPSTLNPYKNQDLLMGRLVVQERGEEVNVTKDISKKIIQRLESNIKSIDFNKGGFVKSIRGISNFTITIGNKKYQIDYEPGRKDFSLMSMFDQGYINQIQLKKAFIQSLDYTFTKGSTSIKAPHFVHRIQEILLQDYDEDVLLKGGLVIKTTLDRQAQKEAEKAIDKNRKHLAENGANNAGLLYVDSKNGDVLAYVGSADYFNEDIDGKVDMVRALRQPGSTIKPLIYALGIEKLGLTLDTPIFDLPISLGSKRPHNSDGRFIGYQALKNALAFSRNIGPIKIFLAVGGETMVKPFLKAVGLHSLEDGKSYGYPLSIGAGEVQMMELANAYMHLSSAGKPAKISPIIEIRTVNGSLVYQKEIKKQKQVIPSGVATMIWKILSNRNYMPRSRVSNFTIPGLKNYATKTGTTDKKEKHNGKNVMLPRDGRIVMYTPSKVAVFRGGNTNGAPMKTNAYGGRINSPTFKMFFKGLLSHNLIQDDKFPESEIKSITIDKLSGRRISSSTPKEFHRSTIGYIHNLPSGGERGGEVIKIDTLCNGKRSPLTPPEDTMTAYVIKPMSFMPDGNDIEQIKGRIESQTGYFLQAPEAICEERAGEEDKNISVTILKPIAGTHITRNFEVRYTISGERPLKYIRIYLDDIVVAEETTAKKNITQIEKIAGYAGIEPGNHQITVEVVDEDGFINKQSQTIVIGDTKNDTTPPYLMEDRIQATSNEDGTYTVYLLFSDDESVVKGGTLSAGEAQKNFKAGLTNIVVESGVSSISYTIEDIHGNSTQGSADIAHLLQ